MFLPRIVLQQECILHLCTVINVNIYVALNRSKIWTRSYRDITHFKFFSEPEIENIVNRTR